MANDCLPPHARTLPVLSCGERAACPACKSEIESLRGLLATTRSDLEVAVAAYRREHEAASVLARQLMDARAQIAGPTP